jgi:glycerol uptake facilitator-like aquaporin
VSKRKKTKNEEPSLTIEEVKKKLSDPWVSMRTAIIVIVIVTILLITWIADQGDPNAPFWDRILPPLIMGISIPVIAVLFYLANRYIFKR